MTDGTSDAGLPALVDETRGIWDGKAEFWDARMGDGNAFHRRLIAPATERLRAIRAGERVLDVACGNGAFARRLAQLGAEVVATDFSQRFLDLARARSTETEHAARIDYRLVDATDEAQLLALGEARFDAAVCTMALMDMPTIDPLPRALIRLLTPAGRFVFAVQHPAFNSNGIRLGVEETECDGRFVEARFVKVVEYLRLPAGKGTGMPGDPAPHWYFHRPLSMLFGACFAAGFVLDGLEEPAFAPEDAGGPATSWLNYPDIPPALVAQVRRGGARRRWRSRLRARREPPAGNRRPAG